jgi:hypothetical protein
LKAGDITLVFYSRLSGSYVHLRRVIRDGNVITLQYRFVAHGSREITTHFALVQLGKLPAGKYEVKTVQLPPDFSIFPDLRPSEIKLIPPERERRVVSLPFTFEVK